MSDIRTIVSQNQSVQSNISETNNFRSSVIGISASLIGLGNVDNTSDLDKPISIATQDALDLKANIESPTFTGTVSGITSAMVGLGNVDNTSDLDKPISTATAIALSGKQSVGNYATGGGTATGTNTGDQTITLTGEVTGTGTSSFATTISNDSVTYAKIQNVSAASRLLGRGSSAGSGDVQEITLGSGLTLTGTVLSSSGGGSSTETNDIQNIIAVSLFA